MQPDEMVKLRNEAGLTQAQLAEAIGMSRKAINEMESGKAGIERRTELAVRYACNELKAVNELISDIKRAADIADEAAVRLAALGRPTLAREMVTGIEILRTAAGVLIDLIDDGMKIEEA